MQAEGKGPSELYRGRKHGQQTFLTIAVRSSLSHGTTHKQGGLGKRKLPLGIHGTRFAGLQTDRLDRGEEHAVGQRSLRHGEADAGLLHGVGQVRHRNRQLHAVSSAHKTRQGQLGHEQLAHYQGGVHAAIVHRHIVGQGRETPTRDALGPSELQGHLASGIGVEGRTEAGRLLKLRTHGRRGCCLLALAGRSRRGYLLQRCTSGLIFDNALCQVKGGRIRGHGILPAHQPLPYAPPYTSPVRRSKQAFIPLHVDRRHAGRTLPGESPFERLRPACSAWLPRPAQGGPLPTDTERREPPVRSGEGIERSVIDARQQRGIGRGAVGVRNAQPPRFAAARLQARTETGIFHLQPPVWFGSGDGGLEGMQLTVTHQSETSRGTVAPSRLPVELEGEQRVGEVIGAVVHPTAGGDKVIKEGGIAQGSADLQPNRMAALAGPLVDRERRMAVSRAAVGFGHEHKAQAVGRSA